MKNHAEWKLYFHLTYSYLFDEMNNSFKSKKIEIEINE